MHNLNSIGIIPARFASQRYPGKPLIKLAGKVMIQHVYEQALKSNLNNVIVATDDERIYNAVLSFGGNVQMTGEHSNGTSRCLEVFLKQNKDYDIMVNVQGDQPFINPEQINDLLKGFEIRDSQICTLAKKINDLDDITNPNIVKVTFSQSITNGIYNALYFSRSPIPHVRDLPIELWLKKNIFFKHIGIYAFSKSFLINKYPIMKNGSLEDSEMLEQLKWLENNIPIRVMKTSYESPNIDTPEDLKKALYWLNNLK
ncbi:MAG: 3-deoxy-manno-octulosonate cytidylyltransferase [Saprospiraceae bacterium]|nr:3-deoxy-manno-octulosonate cytidylyltransferase [Saprospiraceae bacterium]